MGAEGRYEDWVYIRMIEREWKPPVLDEDRFPETGHNPLQEENDRVMRPYRTYTMLWARVQGILFCLVCLSSVAFAADNQWHWIKVGSDAAHAWDVSRGDAEVVIKDGQLKAKLFSDGSTKDVQISLEGSISNGNIRAKETVHESDYAGSTYTGRLTTQKWKEVFAGSTGIETITLSDGFGMIGLTRTIKQQIQMSAKPEPK